MRKLWLIIGFLCLITAAKALAQEFTSADFGDTNPVLTIQGGISTSTNFQLIGGAGQAAIGESSSSAFIGRGGFYYFPLVSTPVLSATAGDGKVTLAWTASIASLGFTVSGYQVGQGTSSGGPYAFSAVGNVLASVRSSLTNSAAYYFIIRTLDIFGNVIATSSQVSATPNGVSASTGTGINKTTGETTPSPAVAAVLQLSGLTSPGASVILLKDGQIIRTTPASEHGLFSFNVSDLSLGSFIFSLYAQNDAGERSSLVTVPITLEKGKTTAISGILLPPIASLDKSEVKAGDSIAIRGETAPGAEVTIFIGEPKSIIVNVKADSRGRFGFNFDTRGRPQGIYSVRVRSVVRGQTSPLSKNAPFRVGERNLPSQPVSACGSPGDFNHDCRVDLVDFSIILYWFEKANPPPPIDLNHDNAVNLIDFSILMYYWTG